MVCELLHVMNTFLILSEGVMSLRDSLRMTKICSRCSLWRRDRCKIFFPRYIIKNYRILSRRRKCSVIPWSYEWGAVNFYLRHIHGSFALYGSWLMALELLRFLTKKLKHCDSDQGQNLSLTHSEHSLTVFEPRHILPFTKYCNTPIMLLPITVYNTPIDRPNFHYCTDHLLIR